MENSSKTLSKRNSNCIPDQFHPKVGNSDQKVHRKTTQSDSIIPFLSPSPAPSKAPLPVVRLYGSPTNPATSYIRFAILYKPVTLLYSPSETPDFGFHTPVIQYGSDVISGSSVTILRYLDAKFPKPILLSNLNTCSEAMMPPVVVTAAVLQHRSLVWHLERMVRWAEDLAARGGRSEGDPVMGSARMEIKKYAKSYSQLLEVLLEHAQMEEKIVFPVLEREDRGLSKTVLDEERARDLPLMNGIKEDIKAIIVLDSGSSSCQDALFSLSNHLKLLQENCKQHFEEEERGILPLMEATGLTQDQQGRLLEQSLDVMPGTHSHLLKFFMEGLLPQEAMLYLDLITRCTDKDRAGSVYRFLVEGQWKKTLPGRPVEASPILGRVVLPSLEKKRSEEHMGSVTFTPPLTQTLPSARRGELPPPKEDASFGPLMALSCIVCLECLPLGVPLCLM